ncbi:MAG TPA: glycosyltransferase family 2 protein [Gemmatimonadales bacterium]
MVSRPLPRVSIVIPCRNEEAYIGACLDSILASDYPRDRLEVLVADGQSTDGTRRLLIAYAAQHPSIILLDNPAGTTPAALNRAIRAATGDIVVRMDAHVLYPADYVRRLVEGLEESGADNVGGVLETVPSEDTPQARAIAIGLSHPFGVGNSYFRTGVGERREVDTVPFGCYRRTVFDRVGFFDEELVRNQDDEFNFRLIRRGGRVLLLPGVSCRYFARRSLPQLARMFYQYGYFKPLVARKVGRVMTVRQLIPAMLVASLAVTAALGLWLPAAATAFILIAMMYAGAVLTCCASTSRTEGLGCALALAAVFPTLHFSYGAGFLRGIYDHLLTRTAPARDMSLSR